MKKKRSKRKANTVTSLLYQHNNLPIKSVIYTRKSSEEELKSNFNSLDAQREVTGESIWDKKLATAKKVYGKIEVVVLVLS